MTKYPVLMTLVLLAACQREAQHQPSPKINTGEVTLQQKHIPEEQKERERTRKQRIQSQNWSSYGFRFGQLDNEGELGVAGQVNSPLSYFSLPPLSTFESR